MSNATKNQVNDVTEYKTRLKSKYKNILIGGALVVAILGGSYYISQKTKVSYKVNVPYIANVPYGVYEASSVENDGDGELKCTYNKLAITYEVNKKKYSILENYLKDSSMYKSLLRLKSSDVEDIWNRINVKLEDEGNKFKQEYSEKYKEYTNKDVYYKESGHAPFCATKGFYSYNNLLDNISFKVMPTKTWSFQTYGDYLKDNLLMPLKEKLDNMKTDLDRVRDRIDKHY